MAFQLRSENIREVTVLVLEGYLDQNSGKQLRKAIDERISAGRKRFVLDFSLTPIVNSLGLQELLDVAALLIKDHSLRFYLCGLSEICQKSFAMAGLFHLADKCPNFETALARAEAVQ